MERCILKEVSKNVTHFSFSIPTMTNIKLMKLFFSVDKPSGYDRVRNAEIGNKYFKLDKLEEAYTTEHWLVRIYKVKGLNNKGL